MSGLVPLQADIMRYLILSHTSQFIHDFLLTDFERMMGVDLVGKYRTELGMQAMSFGAEITTK